MRRIALAFSFILWFLLPAYSQSVTRICVESIGANGSNNCVEVSATNPFPTSAAVTANTSYTAASSLPTLSAGAGAAGYESLGGAPYAQPVFGSASGGGTQVDATHGLPVAPYSWGGGILGAATAWGIAPSGNVQGVNANILGPLGQQLAAASLPVVLTAAQLITLTPPTSVTANGAANVTATDCSGTITSGGTAQNAFTAQTTLHGFTVANIDTTEPLWISFTTTAAAAGAGSYPLPAATATTYAGFGSFTAPPGFGLNHALSVIATTTSHKFTCTWW
jgi:hypothetical protein